MNKVEFYPVLRKEVSYKLYVHICKEKNRHGNYGVYFGITCLSLNRRWGKNGSGYKNKNKNGEYTYFYKAILKHGWDNFEHIVLHEYLTKWEAEELEKFFIKYYNTSCDIFGYNGTEGGECNIPNEEIRKKMSENAKTRIGEKNPFYGKHHTKKTLELISKSRKGKKCPKLSEALKGKIPWNKGKTGIYTEETRVTISYKAKERYKNKENHPMYGKPCSEETKQKLRDKNRVNSKFAKKTICIETQKIYNSSSEAGRQLNMDYSGVSKACRTGKSYKGLHFKYIDNIL